MRTVTLYRLSGLAVMVGMTIDGLASVLYSRADGVALHLDPLRAGGCAPGEGTGPHPLAAGTLRAPARSG